MKLLRKAQTVLRTPKIILIKTLYTLSPLITDKLYLKMLFRLKLGHRLDLDNPQTYNEKLQWLKLYYRNPLYPILVDKFEYKKYVANVIGEEYVVKNYGVWDSFEEIDFETLPNKFVLKTTHDQGGVVICRNKNAFDFKAAKTKLNKHLERNLYYLLREWPYKDLKPRIIAEELLVDESGYELKDYKFYCFNGEPRYMYISHSDESAEHYLDFFDMNFNKLNISREGFSQSKILFEKPKKWDLMIELSKQLSKDQPHVRIDFYSIDGKLYAGEYTLFQGAGFMPFYPEEWDYKFGECLVLPTRNN